ncbi:MAG: hypothetical protein ACRD9Q_07775 [Nitrososphaeraceae archaeon]
MGFLDKLLMNISAGQNSIDPLFGGLIPRRIDPELTNDDRRNYPTNNNIFGPSESQTNNRVNHPLRPSGIDKISQANQPMNVKYDTSGEELALNRAKFGLEREKFGLEKEKFGAGQSQDVRDFNLKDRESQQKQEIELRKQALDEWKARNPEGEIKVDENGKIMIIDKRTGESIDTGLTGEHFSEEEKLKKQHIFRMDEIDAQSKAAMDRAKLTVSNKTPSYISPSQQRVARDDAAIELLRDPRYSWLKDKGFITTDNEGTHYKNPVEGYWTGSKKDVEETIKRMKEFQDEVKIKAQEIMNISRDNSMSTKEDTNNDTIEMISKDTGKILDVPKSEVEAAKKAGHKLKVESDGLIESMPEVDDTIELFYDRAGKVIGSRNRKNTNVSPFEKE